MITGVSRAGYFSCTHCAVPPSNPLPLLLLRRPFMIRGSFVVPAVSPRVRNASPLPPSLFATPNRPTLAVTPHVPLFWRPLVAECVYRYWNVVDTEATSAAAAASWFWSRSSRAFTK